MEANKKLYDAFLERYLALYEEENQSIPIFVNYGTNRAVLDIPLRIRKKHEFSKWTALERAMENELDYRTFFEWFRNQEDYEAGDHSGAARLAVPGRFIRVCPQSCASDAAGVSKFTSETESSAAVRYEKWHRV